MSRTSTGIDGLDRALRGGFIPNRAYLIGGGSGTGKTILGLQFLLEGVRRGEGGLYISLGEPREEIEENIAQMGWDLDGVEFLDLSPNQVFLDGDESYDVFSPTEVEREKVIEAIKTIVMRVKPQRVVLDSITNLRMLCTDEFQYRKYVMSLMQFLRGMDCTALLIAEIAGMADEDSVALFACHGVLQLENRVSGKNLSRRLLQITKFRGSDYISGRHEYVITNRGIKVFSRLEVPGTARTPEACAVPSGIPEIDTMLHGGLDRGATNLIAGHTGTGKTTLAMSFLKEAMARGERCLVYLYEEDVACLTLKLKAVNLPFDKLLASDRLRIREVSPIFTSSDQFAGLIQEDVAEVKPDLVVVDSMNSYLLSVEPEDKRMTALYELCEYLRGSNVTTIFTSEVSTIIGDLSLTEEGYSHVVDTIMFIRYLEQKGDIYKMINVFKKRMSSHGKEMRQFEITPYGITVGEPLVHLRGVLTGSPVSVRDELGGT